MPGGAPGNSFFPNPATTTKRRFAVFGEAADLLLA
jgi:hypothetical protein